MEGLTTGAVLWEKPTFGTEPTRLYDQSRYGNHGTYTDVTDVQLPSVCGLKAVMVLHQV